MHSSLNQSNSIGNALFDAAVQLSVPTVASTGSLVTKTRAYSHLDDSSSYSPIRQTRSSLSSLVLSFPRTSDSERLPPIPASPIATEQTDCFLTVPVDKNNNPRIVTSKSEEFLSLSRFDRFPRHSKSIKSTLKGFWQGFTHDDVAKESVVETPVKKNSPSWKAFAKVVTSLLTFTRTRKERYEWIQLVGHPGTFKEGYHDGFILKERSEHEQHCCEALQKDLLKDFVPKYNGIVQDDDGKFFIEIEDLLSSFNDPCIMDCKIGVRTYLEEDLDKSERDPEPRADLYEKMISIDPTAPTAEEHAERKIVKPRYMIWRESLSSSQDLGFRIEAIKKFRGLMSKEFQRIKERDDVKKQLREFLGDSLPRAQQYLDRLIDFRSTCLRSKFFRTHEIIGSSLLFVHDANKTSFSMIDFGKTRRLPEGFHITHFKSWTRGSREDGYLLGIDNLISLFDEIIYELQRTFS